MFDTVKEIEDKYRITFSAEHSSGYTDFILNVFNNTNEESLDSISLDAIKLNICGIYHDTVTKNYAEMEKYFLMAIALGHANAMYNLGTYHKQVTKNYTEMKKYFLMAIGNGDADADAMYNLGLYHHTVTKNYAEMEKYFLMAIELGHANAMKNLGYYHQNVTKNYAEMEKYYLMAIGKGHANAMYNLGYYHHTVTKNYAEMEKYYLMAIGKGHAFAMSNLGTHYKNDSIKLFASLNTHFNSKQEHTDAFLKEYCKLLKEEAVQSHIQDVIRSRCESTNSAVNKHLYTKYIQTKEKATGAYASNFTIVAHLDANPDEAPSITKTYHVHSHVLNSEYFLHLLDSGFMETSSITMEVSDFRVMDILLKYLYTNEWTCSETITKEQLKSICQIADEFGFDTLTELCNWTDKLNGLYR